MLIAAGYDVQLAPTPTRWARQTDMWGLWDMVAVCGSRIRFVQVKTNHTASPQWREAATAWKCPPGCTKELWIFKDGIKEPIIKLL